MGIKLFEELENNKLFFDMDAISEMKKDEYFIKQSDLKIGKEIGNGSYGIVYRGRYKGKKVAIKAIKKEVDEDIITEFNKEVELLKKFKNEYIIDFYGISYVSNKLSMITELAKHGSLQNLILKKLDTFIPMRIRTKMMIDSAKGISYLHSNGILHRDIKLDNILVLSLNERKGVNAKLADFGTSKIINQLLTDAKQTLNVGSPVYMAPEVKGGIYNWQADVYSFAVTMYECFSRTDCYPKSEFKFSWDIDKFVAKGKRRPKPDNVSNGQFQLIEKCWKQDPKLRISMVEVINVLERMGEINQQEEMKQIEEWTGMKLESVIFDSNIDNWNQKTSVFDQRIINQRNLVFIIEDEFENKFGGYINAKINGNDDWITDPKAFVFSLRSNGRLKGMLKFDIDKEDTEHAFYLFNQSDDCLFAFGIGIDIGVCKENKEKSSSCRHQSFKYNEIQNSLCGKFEFKPKRITVTKLIDPKQQEEIKQIEKWTGLKFKKEIFDSDFDNWNGNTSMFCERIINNSNLVFLIEDEEGNKFGCYVSTKINACGYAIDPKSFVFSLRSNGRLKGMTKFDIKDPQYAFFLCNQTSDWLFLIGFKKGSGCAFCICKENKKSESFCGKLTFNYNGIENSLRGKSEKFAPKRISVIQMD